MRMDVRKTENSLGENLPSIDQTLDTLVAEWREASPSP
jgi:hypothetical protein